jgi:hypothetical protein
MAFTTIGAVHCLQNMTHLSPPTCSNVRMTPFHPTLTMRPFWIHALLGCALSSCLSGCGHLNAGAGIGMNVPIFPGVSVGVNVGTGGVDAGVNAQSGPVGVGVGVNGTGQVTGRAGVGASTPGPVSVGGGVGVGGVLYEPKK